MTDILAYRVSVRVTDPRETVTHRDLQFRTP